MPEDGVVHGIIEAGRLSDWAKTFHSSGTGQDSPLLHEAKVHFGDEGIVVSAVDAANVAMFERTTLAPRGFEAFESPGQVTIGLSLGKIIDRLGPAASDQLVEFTVNMETRHLELRYGATEMSIALIDPDSIRNEPDGPDIDLPNTVTLEGQDLRHAVDVADMLSETIIIEANPDERNVTFRSRGDTDDATVTYGDAEVIDAEVSAEAESVFSVGYTDAMTKPIPDATEVTLRFGDEFPMRLRWEAFEGAFEVNQLLAPRIQSN